MPSIRPRKLAPDFQRELGDAHPRPHYNSSVGPTQVINENTKLLNGSQPKIKLPIFLGPIPLGQTNLTIKMRM